jgi:hypothetical protein
VQPDRSAVAEHSRDLGQSIKLHNTAVYWMIGEAIEMELHPYK